MAGSTPIYGFPYPQSTDLVADYPALGQELATDVETVISGLGSGLNIVTPTSIANTGGSAVRSGGQVTFTGVSSISLNGIFSATYDNYRLIFDSVSASGSAAQLTAQFRTAGTPYSGSQHFRYTLYGSNSSVVAANWVAATTSVFFGSSADVAGKTIVDIIQPFSSSRKTAFDGSYQGAGSTTSDWGWTNGFVNVTNSFDGIGITIASGSMTGIVRCYGYKNS